MRLYWDDITGRDEDGQSTLVYSETTSEELESTLTAVGQEYTIDDYVEDEDIYEETLDLYLYIVDYLRTQRPGILQRFSWNQWTELVTETTDVIPPATQRMSRIPRPVVKRIEPWRRQLVSLGTCR